VATLNTNQEVSFDDEIIYPINTDGIAFWTTGDDGTDQPITSKTVPTTAKTIAYTLVSPDEFEANKINYTLAITYTHGSITYTDREVDVTLTKQGVTSGSTAGYSFLITLTFNEGNIVAKATVANWVAGTAVNVPF
jgi:hypothetical protein